MDTFKNKTSTKGALYGRDKSDIQLNILFVTHHDDQHESLCVVVRSDETK